MNRPVAELPLAAGARLGVRTRVGGWLLELMDDGEGAPSRPEPASSVVVSASRWLAGRLTGWPVAGAGGPVAGASGPAAWAGVAGDDFQVLRFAGADQLPQPAHPPAGERQVTADQTHRSVVVDERLVVKWLREVDDVEHPALRALGHLAEVGFDGVPPTLGALTWLPPSGRELPCAFVTGYLAGARDGWDWCVAALEAGERPGFPAELGRLTARLHVALGSPSTLMPLPVGAAGVGHVRRWHGGGRRALAQALEVVTGLDAAPAGPDGTAPRRPPSVVLGENRSRIESAIDRLLDLRGRTPVQHIHGDLHVGQVLQWNGGLAVIDFDGNPALDTSPSAQPAARDVAQLLLSLDQVARIVDRRSGFVRTAELDAWSVRARSALLAAYQDELAAVERPDVLDLRLLAPFLVEQACRDLNYAARFLPRWAYATTEGLPSLLDTLPGR